jgi:hypothetical protein
MKKRKLGGLRAGKEPQSARKIARKAGRKNKSEYDLDDGFTAKGRQIRRLALISKLERLAESRLVELKDLHSMLSESEANMKAIAGSSMTEKEVLEALSAIDSKATPESIEAEFSLLRGAIKDKQEQVELLNDAMDSGDVDSMVAAMELVGDTETEDKWGSEKEQSFKDGYHQGIVSAEDLSLKDYAPKAASLDDLISHGGPATYEDYQQVLEEEAERNRSFKGAKTESQYKANKDYGGGRHTVFNDPVLQRRFNAAKSDVESMDCADILFSALRTKERNTNIFPTNVQPGDPRDCGNLYPEDGQKQAHQYVMDLLKKAKPFAFPSWWFSECRTLWRIRHLHLDTHDYPMQFPMCATKDIGPADAAFMRSLKGKEKAFSTLSRRRLQRNSNIGFPEQTPFSNTFVALEKPEEMLIYQRARNQQSQVRQFMSPTSAVSPDGQMVQLDLIYATGFLFSSDVDFKMTNVAVPDFSGNVIFGAYTGYVISYKDCPNDMDFLRIPILVPMYLDGLAEWMHNYASLVPDNHGLQRESGLRHNNWFQQDSDLSSPLNHLMQAIDDHSVVQVEFTGSQKRQKRRLKAREGINVSLKKYSRVQMSGGVTMPSTGYGDGGSAGLLPKWKLDHRVDCREHDRCYIRRGKLPISTDERSLLEGRGYTIYTDRKDVSPRDARRFNRRRIPHPDGIDWVAIRTIRIPQHEKGPEGKKVVPLVRVTSTEVIGNSLEYELSDPLKAV